MKRDAPWFPIAREQRIYPVIAALRALKAGVASPDQQQLALTWIIYEAGGYGEPAFHDDQRHTDFYLGRQFVGQQVKKFSELKSDKMEEVRPHGDGSRDDTK